MVLGPRPPLSFKDPVHGGHRPASGRRFKGVSPPPTNPRGRATRFLSAFPVERERLPRWVPIGGGHALRGLSGPLPNGGPHPVWPVAVERRISACVAGR